MTTVALSQKIAGRFVVESPPRRGGAGDVYRARDARSGDVVALKVLRDAGPLTIGRLEREARILMQHAHPALPRYVWHGKHEGDTPCIALEWIEGPTLSDRLASGPLSAAE